MYFPSLSFVQLCVTTCCVLLIFLITKLFAGLINSQFSPLRAIPGPPGGHLITGHLDEMAKCETDRAECHERWFREYGHVIVYKSILFSDRLATTDPKALNHILGNSFAYFKPDAIRLTLGRLIGEGIIFSEASAHKRQRRAMNPAFSIGHIREMTEIFVGKALELKDVLLDLIEIKPNGATVDIVPYLSRTTLDIVGLAGFNYSFNSVKAGENSNELAIAFSKAIRTDKGYMVIQLLVSWFPPLSWFLFDKATRASDQAQRTMRRIGRQLVEEKKRLVLEAQKTGQKVRRKDLLSLLIKANMSTDVSPENRLSDDEVMNQIPTFFIAGHETTSTGLTWAIYELSTNADVQKRLRTELRTIQTDTPSMDELNSLKYLDCVVREVLRLNPPFENTIRIAQCDDIIPLEKPFVDRNGKLQDRVQIKAGEGIFIPILVMNRLESVWGPDYKVFNPDRWESVPEVANTVPSVWANQLTFLNGPRACIGYRFAVMEMKAILFTILRAFDFQLAVDPQDILRHNAIITRPLVRQEREKGTQLPVIIRHAKY